jgi:hypothetical protein
MYQTGYQPENLWQCKENDDQTNEDVKGISHQTPERHTEPSKELSFANTPQPLNLLRVTCYTASLYVVHFKRALNSGEAQGVVGVKEALSGWSATLT